ncbi:hypothetical protein COOONC_12179 [Cooperia oncophora]
MSPPSPCLHNCTFVTVQDEFELERAIIDPAEMTSSVYFLGNLVLGQMYCMAADRIGRRPVLVWSLLVSGIAGVLAAFASNFYLMLFGRFIQGSFFNVSFFLLVRDSYISDELLLKVKMGGARITTA